MAMNSGPPSRAQLSAELERLRARAERLDAELAALVRARSGAPDDDEHDPEGEPFSAQWSLRTGLLESARADVLQAEAAMQRFEDGSYGTCLTCHGPIPSGQLEVRPFREQCVSCS